MRFKHILPLLLAITLLAGCKSNPEAKLNRAVKHSNIAKMETLLKEGSDVNKMVDGETPLMVAVSAGQPRAVAWLLENGAEITVKNPKGQDLWALVMENKSNPYPSHGQAEALALLVGKGLEPRLTLLEAAKKVDSKELTEALIARGGDLNERDENGWTPLHHAAREGHEETTLALIEAGAEVNAESTKTIEKTEGNEDGSVRVALRLEAGTRPMDVADTSGSKGQSSCYGIVSKHGGEKNKNINNIGRP